MSFKYSGPKPKLPYDIYNEKEGRRIYGYYKALKKRVDDNYALDKEEKTALIELGTLIAKYEKEVKRQRAEQQALLDIGAARAQLDLLRPLIKEAELRRELDKLERFKKQELAHKQALAEANQRLKEFKKDQKPQVQTPVVVPDVDPAGQQQQQEGAVGGVGVGGADNPGDQEQEEEEEADDEAEQPGEGDPPRPPGGGLPPGDYDPAAAAVVMANAPKGTELLAIPTYSGSGTDCELWLDLVERAASTYNWDDGRKSGAATMRLTDKALIWVDAQKKTGYYFGKFALE